MWRKVWGIVVASLLFAGSAAAFDRTYGNFKVDDDRPGFVLLEGPVSVNAARDFRSLLQREKVHTLLLDSRGGSVLPALEVAEIIHTRGLNTEIPFEGACASSCSYLFFAGRNRLAAGRLGVHQFTSGSVASQQANVTEQITQEMASRIIGSLTQFNTPPVVLVKMYETPPDKIYWFSPQELSNMGFDKEAGQVAVPVIAPQPAPAPQPQPARVPRPSFDCAKASTPAEYAICGSVELADMDVRMAQVYARLKIQLTTAQFKQVRAGQRAWIKRRESCGANEGCIAAIYRQRLAELGG